MIADGFFGLLEAAELEKGLAACFGGGEAATEIVVDVELEVGRKFSVQFPFELRPPEMVANAEQQCAKAHEALLKKPQILRR